MEEKHKTKKQLIEELVKLRKQIAELEKSESERKKIEDAQLESEELYKTLLKTSPDAVAVLDLEAKFIEVSQQYLKMHGFIDAEEVLGSSGFERIAPEDYEKARIHMQKVLKEGLSRNAEFILLRKDRSCFIGELNGSLIKNAEGNAIAIMATIRDITNRKREEEELQRAKKELEFKIKQRTAELAKANIALKKELRERKRTDKPLRESEEIYKQLVRTSPDAVAVHDLNGTTLEVSNIWLEMFGFEDAKDVIGKSGFEFVAPESWEKASINLQRLIKGSFVRNMELTWLRKNGTTFIGELNGSLIKDAYGKPKAIMATTRDITERNRSEEMLRESEEMYRTLMKTSPDPVAVHDLDGTIIEVSDRWLEMWGYESVEEVLGRNGFEFISQEDHKKAMKSLRKVLDKGSARNIELTMLRKDGTRFIAELNGTLIKDAYGKPKAIMAASRDITDRKMAEDALRKSEEKLQQEVKSLRNQIKYSKSYPEIIGNSPKILKVIDLMHQVARANSTVLIYGETGSGKDLIAKAIHHNSLRKERLFLILNCATLPENLIESELFGYVKGAFTGASNDKKGLFEAADKGTIFLNEIGDLPLELQGKLLHVLESQQIRRLGDNKIITIDVRIIAATNKNLNEEVIKGNFREGLFYRLNVLFIKVPPLRERKEDIPLLAKYFLNKYSASMDKNITNISQETMDILYNYHYPGNVRELENIIQRSIVIAQGSTILPQHLPEELRNLKSIRAHRSLADFEKQMIEDIIQQCKGNLGLAAKKLGVHRATLWRKMKKLNIGKYE